MHNIPTAEEFFDSPNIGVSNTTEYMYCQKDVAKKAIEFVKLHVEKIKNLQESKYYAGETGYILKEEWNEILTNIK